MSETPELRASDADRERTVVALRDHAGEGRLSLEEFSERMEQAYRARTLSELDSLTRDLPATAGGALDRPRPRPRRRFTLVAFGSAERTGRWRLRRHLAWITFGNADLDLRNAQVEGRASITAFLLFGNLDVYIPEEVAADLTGVTIFGHRHDHGLEPPNASMPYIRVRVIGLFGTMDLWRIPRRLMHAGWREIIKTMKSERRARQLPPG